MSTAVLLATATASKSGSTVTATVNGITTTVQVARDLTVASGDVLLLNKVGPQWFAVCRVYAAAPAAPSNDTPPNPKPPSVTGNTVFAPVETRTWRDSSWTATGDDRVYQGQYGGYGLNTGCVFYGSGPRSLAGATVNSATIRVKRVKGGAFAAATATMRLMTQRTRPAGAPTLTSSTTGPNLAVNATNTAFTVPTAWAQAMVDGTAGGLAFYDADGSPYMKFAGLSDGVSAFSMTINWTR